jgi:hypothetical protein
MLKETRKHNFVQVTAQGIQRASFQSYSLSKRNVSHSLYNVQCNNYRI